MELYHRDVKKEQEYKLAEKLKADQQILRIQNRERCIIRAQEYRAQTYKDTITSHLWVMPNAIYQLNIEDNWIGTPPPPELGLNPKRKPHDLVQLVTIFGRNNCPWIPANFEKVIKQRQNQAIEEIAKWTLPERKLHE